MAAITSKKIFLLTVLLALIGTAAFADTGSTTKLYSLPIAEVESILSDWLTQSGFAVQRSPLEMGQIKLSAGKSEEQWEIYLKPQSALATEVKAQYSGDSSKKPIVLKEMDEYISAYIKDPPKRRDDHQQTTPVNVLSHVNSTVCVQATFGEQSTQFSGFFINSKGLIICTTHDLETFQEIKIILHDGAELRGELVKLDSHKDLALIHCDIKSEAFVSLLEGRNLAKIGERIYSIGCPANMSGRIYAGNISGPPRKVNNLPFWQANLETRPGSSGSPVFDTKGKLIGMVKGRFRGTNSVGFLIPLETILSFVKEP
jgi:serine protease Do